MIKLRKLIFGCFVIIYLVGIYFLYVSGPKQETKRFLIDFYIPEQIILLNQRIKNDNLYLVKEKADYISISQEKNLRHLAYIIARGNNVNFFLYGMGDLISKSPCFWQERKLQFNDSFFGSYVFESAEINPIERTVEVIYSFNDDVKLFYCLIYSFLICFLCAFCLFYFRKK